ncbi:disintegrin and metalloproteinase domain-containing protein 10-like [Ornithodoros turicata]|uniref:disintegrin and metalloproteinase domain-containing protein 10-like n=1 Tax=Ornithodoros turicata TaxID=34597 RepID=UPI00313941C6
MIKATGFLATLQVLCLVGVSSELSDFVTKYERVRMHSFNVPQTKGVDSMRIKPEAQGGYRVSFEAYGQKFNLSLAEDPRHVNRIPVYVHNNSGVSRVTYDSDYTIYIGRLEDNPRSEVMGYFRDGIFDGVIRTENNVYFVEPADSFFLEKQNYDAVVYSGTEVMAPDCITMDGGVRACFQNKTHAYGPSKMLQKLEPDVLTQMSGQRLKESNANLGKGSSLRVCGIELLADHSFYRSRNRNINVVVQEMILHLHYADLVFRNTDFNLPFRIGLIPEKVTIYTDPNTKGYPLGQEDLSAKDYLASFSFYVQRHCLVVGFSHRPFESNTLGISFVANPDPEGPVGGICELPMRFIDQDTIHSFNIASITTSTSNRKRVPHGVSFGTVTHEIGHSFGSPHDPAADPACHPIGKSGFFIMVKYSVDGSLPNHRAFSPCSVRDMRKVVKAKGTCLAEDGARCGNGIIEPGEECDCGSDATCETLDPCCSPAMSQVPQDLLVPSAPRDRPCTIRRTGGNTCSPRSSACCNEQCGAMVLSTGRNTTCRPFDECMATGMCDDKGVCRPVTPHADGYPCRGTKKTCRRGKCSSTPCQDKGMQDCVCMEEGKYGNNECHICCRNSSHGLCMPAIEFGVKAHDGRLFVQRSDFFCHGRRGQCDGFGICIVSPTISHSSTSTADCRIPLRILLWATLALLTLQVRRRTVVH